MRTVEPSRRTTSDERFDGRPPRSSGHPSPRTGADIQPSRSCECSVEWRKDRLSGECFLPIPLPAVGNDSGAREERQLLWSLVEQMPAIAWTTDRELRFTSSVGGGLAELGLTPGEVVGRTLQDYFETDDAEGTAVAAHQAALEG